MPDTPLAAVAPATEDAASPLHDTVAPIDGLDAPVGETREDVAEQERTCFDRWFGPMQPGSMRTFVFALCNTAFGSGVLMLPWVFATCGIPLALFLVLMSGTLSFLSLRMLANAASVMGQLDGSSYDSVVKFTLGIGWSRFVRGLIFVYCFGSVISYFIFLGQLTKAMFHVQANWYQPAFIFLMFCVLLLPSMLRLSYLRYFNLLAVCCLPVVVLCLVGVSFQDSHARADWYAVSSDASLGTVIQCAAICFYAFSCHVSLFGAYGAFHNPLPRRMQKVLQRTVAVQVAVYSTVGICGALAFGAPCIGADSRAWKESCTPDNVLRAKSFTGVLSVLPRLGMFIAISVSIPINVFAAREQILDATSSILNPEKRKIVIIYTSCFLGLAVLVAMMQLQLTNILSITGGFGAVTFMFTVPFLITLKLWKMRLVRDETRHQLIGSFMGITDRGLVAVSLLFVPAIIVGYAAGCFSVVRVFM